MNFREGNKGFLIIKKATAVILSAVFIFGASGCSASSLISSVLGKDTKMEEALAGDAIYDGITVNGADVGGLTQEECALFLKERFSSEDNETIFTIAFNDKTWEVTPKFLGTEYDYDKAARAAYEYARTGSVEENYNKMKALEEDSVDIKLMLITDNGGIEAAVERIAEEIDIPAQNATIERGEGGISITQDSDGYTVNKEATVNEIKDMLNKDFGGIYVINATKTEALVKKSDLEENYKVLGTYSTSFSAGDWGRNENIRIASSNINGTVVQPGEVFSSYNAMGEQTLANGYQYAGVIENGVLTSGVGGGVCQVSTTLYNAAIRAEMEIVERKNHSLKIGYVPAGMDAAIAGTYTDFKFKNNTEYPVYVEMYTESNKVYASIYGYETRPANRTIEFESVYVSSVGKPAEKITYDPELPEGERVITKTGVAGSIIDVYKLVYIDGNLESREYFNRSKYSATADEVTVGQKKIEEGEAAPDVSESNNTADNTTVTEPNNGEDVQGNLSVEGNLTGENNSPEFELIVDEDGNEVYVLVE